MVSSKGRENGKPECRREDECATTLTFWDSAAAMEATRVTASRLRTEAAQAVGAAVTGSQEFEVAIHTGDLT
jgi:hypothetical protein